MATASHTAEVDAEVTDASRHNQPGHDRREERAAHEQPGVLQPLLAAEQEQRHGERLR